MMYMEITDLNRQKNFAAGEASLAANRSMIPPRKNLTGPGPKSTNAIVSYPEDWEQLSKQRMGGGGYIESPANLMVHSALEARVGQLQAKHPRAGRQLHEDGH